MRCTFKLLLCLLFAATSVDAQWEPANGIGGTATCFASCTDGSGGSYVFSGTTDGVIRSTDDGLTWAPSSNGLTSMSVHALTACRDGSGGYMLFAGTGRSVTYGNRITVLNGGVFVSSDYGASWIPVGLDSIDVTSLASYPNASGGCDVFAGTQVYNTVCLFRSTNSGLNWDSVTSDSIPVFSIFVSANGAGDYYIYTASGLVESNGRSIEYLGGVDRSTDNGTSWSHLLGGFVNCIAARDSDIFAGTLYGLYYSSNSGTTWKPDTFSLNGFPLPNQANGANTSVTSIAAIPDGAGGTVLFAGISYNGGFTGSNALLRSTDEGASWSYLLPRAEAVASVPDGTGGQTLFATGAILLRSTDNGVAWQTSNVSLADDDVSFVTTVQGAGGGSDIIASCSPSLVRSTDGGVTWTTFDTTNLMSPFVSTGIGAFTSTPKKSGGANLYIGCYGATGPLGSTAGSFDYLRFYESTNDGVSWNSLSSSDSNTLPYNGGVSLAAAPNLVGGYNLLESSALASNALHVTTDNGATWVLPSGLQGALSFIVNDSTVYAIWGGVYYSTDGGLNWTETASPGGTSSEVTALAANGKYLLAGTLQGGVFLSTDKGATWNPVNSGPIDTVVASSQITSVAMARHGSSGYYLFASTFPYPYFSGITQAQGHLFLSTSLGATWEEVSGGLPSDDAITDLVVNSNASGTPYLYAGFGQPLYVSSSLQCHGIWRRSISDLAAGLKERSNQARIRFSLSQNFPNPFNPSTIITYQLPAYSHVTLQVFDVLGRRVKTLVNENQTMGNHDAIFDARGLASGVYFYRLQAGNLVQVRKLILIK